MAGSTNCLHSLCMSKGKQVKSSELLGLVARRLKAARMAFDENAAAVARELGVSPQVLNSYENGRNYPDEFFLVQFCNLTGCTTDWIIRGKIEVNMPAAMAARIGHFAPDLIPDLLVGLAKAEEETKVRARARVKRLAAKEAAADADA